MCDFCDEPANGRSLTRRGIVRFAAIATTAFATAHDARATKVIGPPKPGSVLSPDDALDRLMKGNARYVDGVSRRHDFKHEREALSAGQNPFAASLAAPIPASLLYCFDTARGDIFVCRVAGNIAAMK